MELPNVIGIGVLAMLAGASWWLLSDVDTERYTPTPMRHAPDAWLVDATTTAMGADGKPHYRVSSQRQEHFRDDQTSEHQRPYVTIFRPEGPPWQMHSDRAWVSADGDLVLLKGDVIMTREAWTSAEGMYNGHEQLVTSNLLLRPDEDYAETDAPVLLVDDSSRIDAVGMRAYLNIDRVQFLSRVRSSHVPAKDAPDPS